jgi:hypothetical protein
MQISDNFSFNALHLECLSDIRLFSRRNREARSDGFDK